MGGSNEQGRVGPERAALHEAGHAVVSVVLRTGVRRVVVYPKAGPDELRGATKYRDDKKRFAGSSEVLERQGATTLGGIAAERVASGKPEDGAFGGPDLFRALDIAMLLEGEPEKDVPGDEVNRRFGLLLDRAVTVLEARWTSVEAVAGALLHEGKLDRRRLLELIDPT